MRGEEVNGGGVTISWLQFALGVLGLMATVFGGWHSIVTKLEVVTSVQNEQLTTVRESVRNQETMLTDVRERVVRIEERSKR